MPNWTDDNGVSHFKDNQENKMDKTRAEHLAWCKERAISEYDFYTSPKDKQRNGLASMMSDIGKHPETNHEVLKALIFMHMTKPMTRQEFVNFINGFN